VTVRNFKENESPVRHMQDSRSFHGNFQISLQVSHHGIVPSSLSVPTPPVRAKVLPFGFSSVNVMPLTPMRKHDPLSRSIFVSNGVRKLCWQVLKIDRTFVRIIPVGVQMFLFNFVHVVLSPTTSVPAYSGDIVGRLKAGV